MSEPNYQDRRREPRYDVSILHCIPAKIKRKAGEPNDTIDGELLALSRSGAKVSAAACLQFAEEITLQITFGKLDLAVELAANVCWIRPANNRKWLIGCSFSPPLSDESIAQLAASGIIERRQQVRQPICIAATAKWQLEEASFPVEVRDYSTGGFCFVSPRSARVGHGVHISITTSDDQPYQISGRVCWHLERDGKHLIGCIFSASEDVAQLLEAVEKVRDFEQKVKQTASTPSPRRQAWPQQVATMLLMIAAALFAASIPYWIANRPSDKRIAPLQQNASLRDPVARPLVSTTSHDDLPNETRVGLSDRSSPRPLGDDVAASDEQSQPQESSDEIPSSSSAPTPSDRMTTSTTPSPPQNTKDAQTLPVQISIPTDSLPTAGAQDKPTDSRGLMDLLSGWGDGDSKQDDIPVRDDPLAKPAPSAEHDRTGRSEEVAQAPTDAEINPAYEAFVRGTQSYRRGEYPKAIAEFQVAAKNDSQNSLYFYLLAMSQFQANDLEGAEKNLQVAIRLEKGKPIENWHSLLSQYHGNARHWVERRRLTAQLRVGS